MYTDSVSGLKFCDPYSLEKAWILFQAFVLNIFSGVANSDQTAPERQCAVV